MRWQILLDTTGVFALMGRLVDRIAGSIVISLSEQISNVRPPSGMSLEECLPLRAPVAYVTSNRAL